MFPPPGGDPPAGPLAKAGPEAAAKLQQHTREGVTRRIRIGGRLDAPHQPCELVAGKMRDRLKLLWRVLRVLLRIARRQKPTPVAAKDLALGAAGRDDHLGIGCH